MTATDSSRRDTEADRRIIEQARQRGLVVTGSQLRHWRSYGLLPTIERRGAGQGPGRPSTTYPPGTLARVSQVRLLLSRGVRLPHQAAALFLHGCAIPERYVRKSLQEVLTSAKKPLGVDELFDRVQDGLADIRHHPRARQLRGQMATRYGDNTPKVFGKMMTDVAAMFLLEQELNPPALQTLETLSQDWNPYIDKDALLETAQTFNQSALQSYAKEVSLGSLRTAHRLLIRIHQRASIAH